MVKPKLFCCFGAGPADEGDRVLDPQIPSRPGDPPGPSTRPSRRHARKSGRHRRRLRRASQSAIPEDAALADGGGDLGIPLSSRTDTPPIGLPRAMSTATSEDQEYFDAENYDSDDEEDWEDGEELEETSEAGEASGRARAWEEGGARPGSAPSLRRFSPPAAAQAGGSARHAGWNHRSGSGAFGPLGSSRGSTRHRRGASVGSEPGGAEGKPLEARQSGLFDRLSSILHRGPNIVKAAAGLAAPVTHALSPGGGTPRPGRSTPGRHGDGGPAGARGATPALPEAEAEGAGAGTPRTDEHAGRGGGLLSHLPSIPALVAHHGVREHLSPVHSTADLSMLRTLTGMSGVSRRLPYPVLPSPTCVWSDAEDSHFKVRGKSYMSDKRKVQGGRSLYSLLGADFFSYGCKINHVAEHISLPPPPVLGPGAVKSNLTPILIINIQLPDYSPSLLHGPSDGPGRFLVLYFALPEGWEPPPDWNGTRGFDPGPGGVTHPPTSLRAPAAPRPAADEPSSAPPGAPGGGERTPNGRAAAPPGDAARLGPGRRLQGSPLGPVAEAGGAVAPRPPATPPGPVLPPVSPYESRRAPAPTVDGVAASADSSRFAATRSARGDLSPARVDGLDGVSAPVGGGGGDGAAAASPPPSTPTEDGAHADTDAAGSPDAAPSRDAAAAAAAAPSPRPPPDATPAATSPTPPGEAARPPAPGPSGGPPGLPGAAAGPGAAGGATSQARAKPFPQTLSPAALQLIERVAADAREPDGRATRERLKLVPHVLDVDGWAKRAPLSRTEHGILSRYNDKPVLTRPQHAFFRGKHYLEIDLDSHSYAYLARRALHGLRDRVSSLEFELALVVQGNRPEELPEGILCSARLSNIDWRNAQAFSSYDRPRSDGRAGHVANARRREA